jgi:hypothetical protein
MDQASFGKSHLPNEAIPRSAATWQDALSHDEHDECMDDFVQMHQAKSTLPNDTICRIVRRVTA